MEKKLNREVQTAEEGAGPTFHRIYSINLPCSFANACEGMRDFQADPDALSPQMMAKFEKIKGKPGGLEVGDEFHIHISGPWDGPVRVIDVQPDSFILATLDGHMEAGRIQFRVEEKGEDVRFVIESVARSRDRLVDLVYDKIPLAKFMQTKMWEMVCEEFRQKASGMRADPEGSHVEVQTEKRDEETHKWFRI